MEKIVIDIDSLLEFKNEFSKNNSKLLDIIDEMNNDLYQYSDSMVSDSSEKFKEIMMKKMIEEKDIIGNFSMSLEDKLNMIIKVYSEVYDDITISIGE